MNKRPIYIFRGSPASGKGTLVPEFCKVLPSPVALIEQDTFRWGFHLIGRQVPDVRDDEHAFAHKNTLMLYEQYVKEGSYAVVVEGLFTWDNEASSQGAVTKFMAIAKKYDRACKSIVLQADKEELLRRNAARPYSVPRGEFEALYANIYQKIDSSEIVIDSTGRDVRQTLQDLQRAALG